MDQPVSSLNLPMYSIEKLENAGFYYCSDIKNNSKKDKTAILNISEVITPPKSKTALDLYQEKLSFQPLKSFIPKLDNFLQTEVVPGCITELSGFPGTGKTQICLHLAVGANGEVVFIHTNNNLNSARFKEIAEKFEIDETVLEKILCIKAADPVELMASFYFLENWLPDHRNIRLLIIDSIAWPLKQQSSTERSQLICCLLPKFKILANLYNFPVVVTNNLTTIVTEDKVSYTSSFGDSFYHFINNRILLSKEEHLFKATAVKSVSGRQSVISFQL